jgi:hypothetical protein
MLKDHLQLLADNGDELAIQGLAKVKEWEDNPRDGLPGTAGDTYPGSYMVLSALSISKYLSKLVFCYGALLCVTRTRVAVIASTTLVHIYIVTSNAIPFIPVISPKAQRSNWPYSLIRLCQDNPNQQREKPRKHLSYDSAAPPPKRLL